MVGDIHGCYDELVSLLDKVDLKPADRVVAVGDLIVKGPKNREVLDLFREDSRFASVIGNHDLALVRHWRDRSTELKSSQRKTADELSENWQTYFEYLQSLPYLINLGACVVVHAGLRPGVPLDQQSPEDLTELRTLGEDRTRRVGTPWYEVYDGREIALFGHWPNREPRKAKRAIGLDTGCVYGFSLTAFVIETAEFVSVPAQKVYDIPRRQVP